MSRCPPSQPGLPSLSQLALVYHVFNMLLVPIQEPMGMRVCAIDGRASLLPRDANWSQPHPLTLGHDQDTPAQEKITAEGGHQAIHG